MNKSLLDQAMTSPTKRFHAWIERKNAKRRILKKLHKEWDHMNSLGERGINTAKYGYVECPECRNFSWSIDLGKCENCNYKD